MIPVTAVSHAPERRSKSVGNFQFTDLGLTKNISCLLTRSKFFLSMFHCFAHLAPRLGCMTRSASKMFQRGGVSCLLIIACLMQSVSAFSPVGMQFARTLPRASPRSSAVRVPMMGLFDFLQNQKPPASPQSAPARGVAPPSFSSASVPRSYDEIHVMGTTHGPINMFRI